MKKMYISIILLFFFTIILFSACDSHMEKRGNEQTEIVLADAGNNFVNRGFPLLHEGVHATYYFSEELIESADAIIRQHERILEEFSEYNFIFRRPVLFFTYDRELIERGGLQYVEPLEHKYALGWTLFSLSDGELPFWLCVGLELLWGDFTWAELEEFTFDDFIYNWHLEPRFQEMPPFGDMWFIEGFLDGGTDRNGAFALAKYLASFLTEHSDLSTASINTVLEGNYSEIASMIIEPQYWLVSPRFFSVRTVQGVYTFEHEYWDYSTVSNAIPYLDRALQFSRDFLGGEDQEPIYVFFEYDSAKLHARNVAGLAYILGRDIEIFGYAGLGHGLLPVLVHEAIHVLLPDNRTLGLLVEGIPELARVDYLVRFSEEPYSNYERFYTLYQNYLSGLLEDEVLQLVFSIYETVAFERNIEEGVFCYFMLVDAFAHADFVYPDVVDARSNRIRPMNEVYIFLDEEGIFSSQATYTQAGSFVHFLYSRYGLESLLRVYANYRLAYEVFGVAWEDLVMQWKAHIGL